MPWGRLAAEGIGALDTVDRFAAAWRGVRPLACVQTSCTQQLASGDAHRYSAEAEEKREKRERESIPVDPFHPEADGFVATFTGPLMTSRSCQSRGCRLRKLVICLTVPVLATCSRPDGRR